MKLPETQSVVDLGRIDTAEHSGAVDDNTQAMGYHKQNVTNTEAILVMLGGAAIQMRVEQSISGPVEEGGWMQFAISIMDVDSGAVASADIDISSIVSVIEKSTGGAAFSAAGLSVITFGKDDGRVYIDYQFQAGEWTVGDVYKIVVSGIEATIGTDTAYVPAMVWSNFVVEDADLATAVAANQTDLNAILADIGDFSARSQNLKSLLAVLGVPDADDDTLYKLLYSDMLAHATFGLEAISTDIGDFSARTNNLKSLMAVLGVPDINDKNLYTCLVTDRLDSATFGLSALNTDLDAILADVGDFSARANNLKSLLAVLGIPDVDNDTLYKLVYTDMLAHGTHGLAALDADLTTIINDLANGTDGLGALLTAIGLVPGGTPGAALASVWTAGLATNIGTSNTSIASAVHGLAALKALIDTATTDIGTNQTDLDAILADVGDFSGRTNNLKSLMAVIGLPDADDDTLYKLVYSDMLAHGTYGLAALKTILDGQATAAKLEDAMQKLTTPAYNQDTDSQEAIREAVDAAQLDIDHLTAVSIHDSKVFPALPSIDCILTAGVGADTFGAWAEIVDTTGTPIALSDMFVDYDGHISAIVIDYLSTNSESYVIKLAYGASKIPITDVRVKAGSDWLPITQAPALRATHIPEDETIYYQMAAETGESTANVSFRYYLDD